MLWDESSLQAGSTWESILEGELVRADVAVPCVTRDNVGSPWLNFEVGVFSSKLGRAHVLPLLIDLPLSDLRGPLTQFRCFSTSKSELRAFVGSITAIVSTERPSSDHALDVSFETWWPAISAGLHVFRGTTVGLSGPEPPTARGSMRRVENLDVLAARVSGDTTEEELESILIATLRESGVRVIRYAREPEAGADLAVWVDQLNSQLGNPILVELKTRISDSASAALIAKQASGYLNRSAARTILIVYKDGVDQTRINRESGNRSVIFIRLPDFLERLRTEPFDAALQRELTPETQ
jgi:hypothetical protein